MREYAVISEPTSEGEIGQEAIREELSRILKSSIFVQSDRLGRFLRYTVETTLAGDAETLKEYLIGTEVYDRKPPYHPSAGLHCSQRGPEAPQQIKGILRVGW